MILVDLRLHGHSQDVTPPHTLAACVRDLVELERSLGRRASALLGHSFGGKVALLAAGALRPEQVWLIDATPSRGTPGGGAYRMLGILRRLPARFSDRADATEMLEREGLATRVATWMAMNLVAREGTYVWRFDLAGLESLLDDFFRQEAWDVVEDPPEGTEIHLVRARGSDVLGPVEFERLSGISPRTKGHELEGGHWLHVDNPDRLLDLMAEALPGDA